LEFPLLKDHPLKVIYNSLCGIRDTHAVYEKNDKTGATSVTGTAYHSGVERETKSDSKGGIRNRKGQTIPWPKEKRQTIIYKAITEN
jgi:hypothetical protein